MGVRSATHEHKGAMLQHLKTKREEGKQKHAIKKKRRNVSGRATDCMVLHGEAGVGSSGDVSYDD